MVSLNLAIFFIIYIVIRRRTLFSLCIQISAIYFNIGPAPISSFSPAPMIRSKTAHGIGHNQQGGKVLSAPGSPMTDTSKPTRMIARSPSSAKEMLLIWVQQRVNTYPVSNEI